MQVIDTLIHDVKILEPCVFGDERGFFLESYNAQTLAQAIGVTAPFVQDNHSKSKKGVLRGLHYQDPQPQGKLVRALSGSLYDVAVDIRPDSPSLGRWVGVELSSDNKRMLWVPPGLAHGFLVLSDFAEMFYKVTTFYAPQHEKAIRWDDPTLAIKWPLTTAPLLSAKDAAAPSFADLILTAS